MENKSKSTSLVAWTDKGRVVMVPYLLDEMHEQYLEEIKHCSYWTGVELRERLLDIFRHRAADYPVSGAFVVGENHSFFPINSFL